MQGGGGSEGTMMSTRTRTRLTRNNKPCCEGRRRVQVVSQCACANALGQRDARGAGAVYSGSSPLGSSLTPCVAGVDAGATSLCKFVSRCVLDY
jgi:hypothetical protein